MGYHRAGFDVVGVDIEPQPHYPFEFVQADALQILRDQPDEMWWERFDAIHASPPCQDHTGITKLTGGEHGTGWMLAETVRLLEETGLPWVCENVVGPNVRMAGWWFVLCGSMFDLGVRRHRRFGASFLVMPPPCRHDTQARPVSVTGHPVGPNAAPGPLNDWKWRTVQEGKDAMGMYWGDRRGVAQAIPPAYTEFIGAQLMAVVQSAAPARPH